MCPSKMTGESLEKKMDDLDNTADDQNETIDLLTTDSDTTSSTVVLAEDTSGVEKNPSVVIINNP